MNKIECNGYSTKLLLSEKALYGFSKDEIETLQYALVSHSFVNCSAFGVKYCITIKAWLDEIERVYDMNDHRNKVIVSVLNKLI